MQKQWDDIDELIMHSSEDFIVSNDYEQKLLLKLNKTKSFAETVEVLNFNKSKLKISAVSLIIGGLIILALSIPQVQYELVHVQSSMKNIAAFIQYNYNNDVIKYILGE